MGDWEDDAEGGDVVDFATWSALRAYVDGQGELVRELRNRNVPNAPWPETDNPMIRYLIDTGVEKLHECDELETAVAWIVAHAWFESSLEERAKLLRSLTG